MVCIPLLRQSESVGVWRIPAKKKQSTTMTQQHGPGSHHHLMGKQPWLSIEPVHLEIAVQGILTGELH